MINREIKHNCAPLYASFAENIYLWLDMCETEADRRAFADDLTALVMILMNYAIYGKTPDLKNTTPRVTGAWLLYKPNVDSFITSHENGRKGGRPRNSVPPSEYIEQQINGTLPEGKKATAEQIEAVKRLQEKL